MSIVVLGGDPASDSGTRTPTTAQHISTALDNRCREWRWSRMRGSNSLVDATRVDGLPRTSGKWWREYQSRTGLPRDMNPREIPTSHPQRRVYHMRYVWSALRESNPLVTVLQTVDFPSVSGRLVAPRGTAPRSTVLHTVVSTTNT